MRSCQGLGMRDSCLRAVDYVGGNKLSITLSIPANPQAAVVQLIHVPRPIMEAELSCLFRTWTSFDGEVHGLAASAKSWLDLKQKQRLIKLLLPKADGSGKNPLDSNYLTSRRTARCMRLVFISRDIQRQHALRHPLLRERTWQGRMQH
ncbi:hypothetical protein TcWFU_001267 [Taenia crassiceps]|uniref:Uncharacterized protein n=1 Tax=Taenia crassiceps TaxID=6207 RepID=A0ABR4QQI8_9CEST